MNVLITGAGGQLGQDCLRVLGASHAVQGLSSRELDITSPQQVEEAMDAFRPGAVINCAAYTAVDNCETEEEQCRAVNELGPRNLARACAAADCRLVHISTDYVFDGQKKIPQPYREQDPVSPLSAYGRSKLAGERAVAEETDNYQILRTAWLYGMGGGNFLKTMLRLTLADPGRTLRVVNDQYGSLTWTHSLARQIDRVLETNLTGIIHATAGGYCTWYQGACYFLEAMGVAFSLEPCTTADYPTPAHRPANSILDNSRLRAQGLDVMQDWQQDIDDFVAAHRQDLLREAEKQG